MKGFNRKKLKKTRKDKALHILTQTSLGIFDIFISIILALLLTFIYFYTNTSEVTDKKFQMNETSVIYDRTGEHALYKIFGEENRKIVSHEEISDNIRITTLAAEDDNFYNHFGIDVVSTVRAAKANFKANDIEQGASTITQQLARNVFLTRERTLKRKMKEAILAIKIEKIYPKEQILDMYLNNVPYGANAYGVQTASQTYFGKNAKELTLDEAALLSILPNAPSFYVPYGKNANELVIKQKKIIKRTYNLGLTSRENMEEALETDTLKKIKPLSRDIKAPHFVMYVLKQMEENYGREFLEKGGLKIVTSLDWEKQILAEEVLKNSKAHLNNYGASNASLVSIDPKNGEILAMVGSIDYFDHSIDGEVNVSIRERQPGSSFKPIVYAKAFEKDFQPETLIYDNKTNFGPDGSGKPYIPQNYDGKFHGRVSMRDALARSLNIPAVKTLYLAGIGNTIELAERLGIKTLTDRKNYGLALALGGGSIKLLEEVSAFSVFANEGIRHPASAILSIKKSNGETIYEIEKEGKKVLSTDVARKINSILSDKKARLPAFGPNNPLQISGRTVAAKTGTTQDFRDAWTVGYTPSLATGVWAGNNDNSPMRYGAAGTYVAAPIWNKFMSEILQNNPDEKFVAYSPVSKNTPFLSGASGAKKSVSYYDKDTGKEISPEKAKKTDPKDVRTKVKVERHSLLYYLSQNKNIDPAMLRRWENALNYSSEN